ncbi:hypothetical protein JWG39_01420 [Desulforhopalus vacuolatus]|uniref:hypothetical protein n=1 Tax=Desulforhopalus vacuolatus TaxID=40414 RepID=UPI0019661F15|nr:hypothetical protein [Desulforhopalus vacuolatus]MBM9518473.1 hypothetical protein [Desulforhopalus vacuolatus]
MTNFHQKDTKICSHTGKWWDDMTFQRKLYYELLLVVIGLILASPVAAKRDVPESLKEWVPWVLHNQEEQLCTSSYTGKQKFCVWPGTLQLDVNSSGGNFKQRWNMEKKGWIVLPGKEKHWPQAVLINEKSALVVNKNGFPALFVESPGEYTVEGKFTWDSLPESLTLPPGTGLVSPLTVNGKEQVADITSNTLWLSKKINADQQERDVVQTQVYRHITDSIPMLITTQIDVQVSGKPRELIIDWTPPEDQIPVELRCSLPVKLGPDHKIYMQARAGNYKIIYTSRVKGPVDTLPFNVSSQGPDHEYWSFASRNNLRMVKISGVPAVDPGQTSIPREWRSLPAYLVKKGESMLFETIKRGDTEPAPNNFNLSRKFWLDASGKGITVEDTLSGVVHKSPRLEMQNPAKLGRMRIHNRDQLITKMEKSDRAGVEVRQGNIKAQAVSRIEGTRVFPAGGWGQTIENLSAELILQPGWKLFYAQGVDSAHSWVSRWTLLDCFIVLIIVIASFKILGPAAAIVALIALVLSYHDLNAPVYLWLALLSCIAIIKNAPHFKYIKVVKKGKVILLLGLVIVILPYSVKQLREGFYPQLERSYSSQSNQYRAPAVQRNKAEAKRTLAGSFTDSAPETLQMSRIQMSRISEKKPKILQQQFDTQSKVQAGPGVPNRIWNVIRLRWNGPVDASLNVKLYLISPFINMLLILLKIAAIYLLAFLMFRKGRDKEIVFHLADISPDGKVIGSILLFFSLFAVVPGASCSQYPTQELLETLQERLTEPAECFPFCADFNSMDINLKDTTISVKISANSYEDAAVPLPTGKGIFWKNITLDTEDKSALAEGKNLWLLLPKGQNTILLTGQITTSDFQFNLPLKPHVVHFTGDDGWSIEGLDVNKVPEGQLQFIKQEKQDTQNFGESTLPPLIKIERTLQLGVEWYLESTVTRLSPTGTSVYLKIPLVTGESVTDGAYKVSENNIEINMGPKVKTMQWSSVLKKQDALTLVAADTTKWTEIWRLNASPIWHIESTGSPVIQQHSTTGAWQPEWHPWANEKITLNISRPPGIEGETKTIESSKLKVVPGLRSTLMELSFTVRSTRGDQQTIILPENIILQSLKINNRQQPVKNDNTVVVPLVPGSQKIEIKMNSPVGISTFFKVPKINIGLDSVNNDIEIKTGARWVWFVRGPQQGPTILFYSELLIILLVATALGISKLTPLSVFKWIILGLGLSQSGLIPCGIIVVWFTALQYRKLKGGSLSGGTFNFLQIVLILLTVFSSGAIIYAVQHGLLGHPDMQIAGNGSNSYFLRWYQDHIAAVLPQPVVVSIPIMAYRILMLIWALWLAFNLLAWVKWGWECLTTEKMWVDSVFKRKNAVFKRKKKVRVDTNKLV